MKRAVATGKTIEEATKIALQQLQTTQDQVQVKVLKQPSRGFLGIIGTRNAEVEVVLKEDLSVVDKSVSDAAEVTNKAFTEAITDRNIISTRLEEKTASEKEEQEERSSTDATKPVAEAVQEAYQFLSQVVEAMDLRDVKIETNKKEDRFEFRLYGRNIGMIIGKHGHTLDSLQYLVNLVANKHSERYVRIVLDAEGYRMRRQEALENLADRLAEKALRERKEIVLEPMNSAERKVIHTRLQNRNDVRTQSRGEDPYRKIVIIPKSYGIK